MLAQANEQRILVSSLAQRTEDSEDTQFTVNLGTTITNCKRLTMQMLCLDNLFINFKDLTIFDGLNYIKIKPDVFLNSFTLIPFINDQLDSAGSTLILTLNMNAQPIYQQDTLNITGNQQWSMSGDTWFAKLGFERGIDDQLRLIHVASSPYDFSQSALIAVNFKNLSKSVINTVPSQFIVNNNTTYGQRAVYSDFSYQSTQTVVFSQVQSFNRLDVQLLDEDGDLLRTPNGNHRRYNPRNSNQKQMNGGTNLGGTFLTGQTDFVSEFGQLLEKSTVSDTNQDPSSLIDLQWFQTHGSGQPVNLPVDLGAYQSQLPLQRNIDLTTTPSYTMLVSDQLPVLNSKKVVNGGQLFSEINTRLLADQQLSQVISTEVTNRTNADDLLRERTLQDIQNDNPVTVLDLKQGSQLKTTYVSAVDGTIDLSLENERAYFTSKCYYLGESIQPDETDTTMLVPKKYVTDQIATLNINNTPIIYTNQPDPSGSRPILRGFLQVDSDDITQLDGIQDGTALGNVTSFRQFQEANTTQSEATALVQTHLNEETKNREDQDIILQQNIDAVVTDLQDYSTTAQNDLRYYLNTVPLQSLTKATATLDVNNNKISNIVDGVLPQDVTSLSQVQSLIQASSTGLPANSSLSYISNMNPSVSSITASNQKITSVQNGSVSGDVVTFDQLSVTNTNLTNESATRLTNDNQLQTNINTVTTNLATEVTARTNADINLQGQITTLQGQKNKIESVDTNSSLTCSSGNVIDIKANGNLLGKFYQPTGQSTNPLGLFSNDKIQLSSGMNAITCFGTNVTPVNTVVYNALRVQNTDVPASNCYSGLELSTSGGLSAATSNMSLASGHVNLLNDGVQRPFMSIADQNNSCQALSISVGNPFLSPTGTSYTQYLSSLATALSLPQHSFQGSAGYNATTSITLPNQFASKKYIDDLLLNYWTKTLADGRFYMNTVPLQSITKATASVDINNQRITNCLDPINPQDVATKSFVLSNSGGLPSNSTLNSIATSNPTSGSVNMNNQKIVNLATPTLSSDASTKEYVDSVITPQQQQFIYTNSSITNGSYTNIVHSLGADVDGLVFQLYVKYKNPGNGYTVNQWINLGTIDRTSTFPGQLNLQIMSHTTDVSNQCRVYFCSDGVATIDYSGGGFTSPNWNQMSVKIVITKNNGFLVLSSQYATSNLVANSDIDLLSSYRINNLLDPVSDQQPATKKYTDDNFITQTQADARYYESSTTLSQILPPNSSLNVSNQKIINLQQGTNSGDAVTLSQTNTLISNAVSNYIPTSVRSSDNTAGLVTTPNRVDITGRHVMLGNSVTGGVLNCNFMMNTGGNNTVSVRTGVEAGFIIQDGTTQSQIATSRYTAMILGSSSFNSATQKSLYTRGEVWMDTSSGVANLTTGLIVNSQIQCTGVITITPSYRKLKKNIQLMNFDGFDAIRYYNYEYDYDACQQYGVPYFTDQIQSGFMADEVPVSYCDTGSLSLYRSKLQADLIGYLLEENRTQKQRITSLEDRLSQLEQTVQMLVDRIPQ